MRDPHLHLDASRIDIKRHSAMFEVWLDTKEGEPVWSLVRGAGTDILPGILIGANPSRATAIDEAVLELQRRIDDLKREWVDNPQLFPRI